MMNFKEGLKFFEFIYDRQRIHMVRRLTGNKSYPWSEDEVLNKYRFCNVYRQNDKATIYLKAMMDYCEGLDWAEKLFWITLFRRFNVVGFFEIIDQHPRYGFDLKTYTEKLDKAKADGVKLFNEAYTLCQVPFDKSVRPKDKHFQILLGMNDTRVKGKFYFVDYQNDPFPYAELFFHNIKKVPGVGSFLAYQIMQDFSYLDDVCIPDFEVFTHVGPGAEPALDLIVPVHTNKEDRCLALAAQQEFMFRKLKEETGKNWQKMVELYHDGQYLSVHNIQNCLCEYRKYFSLKQDPKKCRKRYYVPYKKA